MSRIEIIDFSEDLVKRTAEEILNLGKEPSMVYVVFPSKRFEFFLKDEFAKRIKKTCFLPQMKTIDEFAVKLYQLSAPAFTTASEMESSYILYKTVKEIFSDNKIYAGKDDTESFSSFYPWALKIMSCVEEILVESEKIPEQNSLYEKFSSLGEYSIEYRSFIENMPKIISGFVKSHEDRMKFTRGMTYRKIRSKSILDKFELLGAESFVFAGFNALNSSEKLLIRNVLDRYENSLFVLRTERSKKTTALSPFRTAYETVEGLKDICDSNLKEAGKFDYSKILKKTKIYPCSNVEHEMIQVFDALDEYLRENKNGDLTKIGVLLPEPSNLMSFVNNVVARFDLEKETILFNITLNYPFQRTPLFQLLDTLLKITENIKDGIVPSCLYLDMIRHPYVKLSGPGEDKNLLRMELHRFEELLVGKNVLELEIDEKGGFKNIEKWNEPSELFRKINRIFMPRKDENLAELCGRLIECLDIISSEKDSYLFFGDFILSAREALIETSDFFAEYPEAADSGCVKNSANLIRHKLSLVPVRFKGTPLAGIQVMGALEFRNINFDAVFIADCIEGVMPDVSKYDPLLPGDIKELFSMRHYGDWESIYASNFFSVLSSAGSVKIFYPEKLGGQVKKRSRFIETLFYESDNDSRENIIKKKKLRFSLTPVEKTRRVKKTDEIKEMMLEKGLSPSSFEDYISCPLKFYFKRILKLEERESLEENPDAAEIGTVVHEALKEYYGKKTYDISEMKKILTSIFYKKGIISDKGLGKIRFWAMNRIVTNFLEWDRKNIEENKIEIIALEEEISEEFQCESLKIGFRGKIDRIERSENETIICDYKSKKRESLFHKNFLQYEVPEFVDLDPENYREKFRELNKICNCFQVLVYIRMQSKKGNGTGNINGKYYFLRESSDKIENKVFKEKKTALGYYNKFDGIFESVLRDIFFNEEFLATPSKKSCSYCSFRNLCEVNKN